MSFFQNKDLEAFVIYLSPALRLILVLPVKVILNEVYVLVLYCYMYYFVRVAITVTTNCVA